MTLGIIACITGCRNKQYQIALGEWQDEFNDELDKIGMFCKTQTHIFGYMTYVSHGQNGGHVQRQEVRSSWLAIAVGPQAIAALQAQPHIIQSGVPGGNCRDGAGGVHNVV